jgi:hypothetical protein
MAAEVLDGMDFIMISSAGRSFRGTAIESVNLLCDTELGKGWNHIHDLLFVHLHRSRQGQRQVAPIAGTFVFARETRPVRASVDASCEPIIHVFRQRSRFPRVSRLLAAPEAGTVSLKAS